MTQQTPFENGRAQNGQFTTGNKAGTASKPHAASVQKLRTELFKAVTPARFRKVLAALLEKAEAGDVRAAEIILNRTLGQPLPADMIERIEELEQQLNNTGHVRR